MTGDDFDRDIPMPPRGGKEIYGWDRMRIGDSRFVAVSSEKLSGSLTYAKLKHGFKFSTRRVEEDGVIGTRVWRVK